MRYPISLTLALLALSSNAGAQEASAPIDKAAPYRIAVERFRLSGDPAAVTSCAARAWHRSWEVVTYPLSDGYGVDIGLRLMFNFSGSAQSAVGLQVHKDGSGSFGTILYRHPMGAEGAIKQVAKIAKICFPEDWKAANVGG